MLYFAIPAAVIFVVALLCADVKVGFWVLDRTEGSGFSFGFYMMTVLGLLAVQVSAVAWAVRTIWFG